MSHLLIVPIHVTEAINAKLEAARVDAEIPCDEWERERGFLFNSLLEYYDEHGTVPEFCLKAKPEAGTP